MISPYSIGNASSDPANSSRVSSSGVAHPARCQASTRAAHASRSSAVIVRTSAEARRRARARLAVRDQRLKPFAEDVLEIVKRDGERSAV